MDTEWREGEGEREKDIEGTGRGWGVPLATILLRGKSGYLQQAYL